MVLIVRRVIRQCWYYYYNYRYIKEGGTIVYQKEREVKDKETDHLKEDLGGGEKEKIALLKIGDEVMLMKNDQTKINGMS